MPYLGYEEEIIWHIKTRPGCDFDYLLKYVGFHPLSRAEMKRYIKKLEGGGAIYSETNDDGKLGFYIRGFKLENEPEKEQFSLFEEENNELLG